MDLIEKNIAFLKKSSLNAIQWKYDGGEKLRFVEEGSNDQCTCFVNRNNQLIRVSQHGNVKQLEQIDSSLVQIIFFFGILNLQEVVIATEKADPTSLFVVIEPNASLFHYALENEDIERHVGEKNIAFVFGGTDQIKRFIELALLSKLLLLLKRPVFCFNVYYQDHELSLVKEFIPVIGKLIKEHMFRLGNSINDSLLGLIQNMVNLSALQQSQDVSCLRNIFSGVPAFVIAAGPSLDKNIQELKRVGNKGIIIAVDTIAERLVKEGIIPHFIASVERIMIWEYFFENKPNYYKNSYLVAPPLVQPKLVRAFENRVILPMRENVREYHWLSSVLGLDEAHHIWMGASCAHIATGFAFHLGASPIVLVGQDLAYGNDDVSKTHATNTTYDIRPEETPNEILTAPGYYGGLVKTQPLWESFRLIYETFINQTKPSIINATEGGAHIAGCEQKTLADVVDTYCVNIIDVLGKLKTTPKTKLDMDNIDKKMQHYCEKLEKISKDSLNHLAVLRELKKSWKSPLNKKKFDCIFKVMQKTDAFFRVIPEDELIYHNLQGPMVILLQKFHTIPNNGSEESLKCNLDLQIEFCEMFSDTVWLIAQVIEENFPWLKGKFEDNNTGRVVG